MNRTEVEGASKGDSATGQRGVQFLAGLAALLGALEVVSLWVAPGRVSDRATAIAFVAAMVLALLLGARLRGRGRSHLVLTAFLVPVSVCMCAFIALTLVVDRGLAHRAPFEAPWGKHRVWSTRGLVLEGAGISNGGNQNSIAAVTLAFERGATGVEVDVFYDAEMGDFVVSHDRPYNLKGGKPLMLSELWAATGALGCFWLDWKKLRHLDDSQLDDALARLREYADNYGIRERVFIEGEDPFHLSACRRAGFATIYDTHPLPEHFPLASVVLDFYRAIYYFGGFTVLSLETGELNEPVYGPAAQRLLGQVPLFLYHAPNDDDLLARLLGSSAAKVILLRDHSCDRFHLGLK